MVHEGALRAPLVYGGVLGWAVRVGREGEGTHKGCPYGFGRGGAVWVVQVGRGGAPCGCPYGFGRGVLGWAVHIGREGEGTHKGRPYGFGRWAVGGGCVVLGGRGGGGEGTHKGCPYGFGRGGCVGGSG